MIRKRRTVLPAVVLALALLPLSLSAQSFPRIANLYGAGLSWMDPKENMQYWKKLGLIAGGGADWHYDYTSTGMLANAERAARTAALVKQANPAIGILPYFDTIEGPDNPALPAAFCSGAPTAIG